MSLEPYAAKAAPPLSDNYYARLFTPAPFRERITVVLACAAEIEDCSRRPGEMAVGMLKLGWWREEVEMLAAGEPRHPVTSALAQTPALRKPRELWFALIDASLRQLDSTPHASMAALREYCDDAGAVYELLAMAFDANASARSHARALGSAVTQAKIVCTARANAAGGRIDLPLELLAEANVQPGALHGAWPTAAIDLLARLGAQAERDLDSALTAVAPGERASLHTVLILAALQSARLAALSARGYSIESAAPGPLSRLWTAWRTARTSAGNHVR